MAMSGSEDIPAITLGQTKWRGLCDCLFMQTALAGSYTYLQYFLGDFCHHIWIHGLHYNRRLWDIRKWTSSPNDIADGLTNHLWWSNSRLGMTYLCKYIKPVDSLSDIALKRASSRIIALSVMYRLCLGIQDQPSKGTKLLQVDKKP